LARHSYFRGHFLMVQCEGNQTCLTVTSYVVPSIGIITANILWFSSYPAIKKALENLRLGSLNPIPFPFMLLNSFIWVVYSVLKKDDFLYFSVIFGFLISLCFCVICIFSAMFEYHITKNDNLKITINRLKVLFFLIAIIFVMSVYIFLIMLIDNDAKQNACGI
jgi:ABC-type multidrug transport system permease subunit